MDAFAEDSGDGCRVESGVEGGAVAGLYAMGRPESLRLAVTLDGLEGLSAGVRGVEAEMRGGVPVLGGDDVLVIRHATVYGVDDGGAVGDGEAAGDEVVLDVD